MIYFICGAICGSVTTLLLYSLFVGKRIQEEQDKATKCISKYNEYRHKIRILEIQNKELEKQIIELQTKHGEVVSVEYYSDFDEVK